MYGQTAFITKRRDPAYVDNKNWVRCLDDVPRKNTRETFVELQTWSPDLKNYNALKC